MSRPTPSTLDTLDLHMLAEVRAGLEAVQKKLPAKYFYDRRGSELFERITHLPEYYLTRTERGILDDWMPSLMARLAPRTLVELGAGSAEKTRILLDAMLRTGARCTYVPIDVSAPFLEGVARRLRDDFPRLDVRPAIADIARELNLPPRLERPALFAFLGSTIGNFHPAAAVRLLRRVHAAMAPGDHVLLGADLRKDAARLHAAYNDAEGVTAEFNRNMLHVLNARFGADFDPEAFAHRAFYKATAHRIEMHLVSIRDQTVPVPGIGEVEFAEGETIRTEISCKYDRQSLTDMFNDAGLRLDEFRTDPDGLYAVVLGSPFP